ncbi:hypothetical protein FPY71_04650 [Aureimonas fodinaquatilis]|uniref:Outer membrane lipoprotein n=1 Tax=Aureimonas fodinaquatilis TaxID=2565783 RepID=A0A5B0E4N6_9HYPH|nr:hypothetical protein [Aureimonas fodinaquatilis]KAA0972389.1 hypothetical protein FPY71_04650 [Aureimonas fodinaquatilis]
MRRIATTASIVLASLSLAACVGPSPDRANIAPAQTGFDGRWGDTSGVAVSTLNGGSFTSTATDTGSLLAQGSYRNLSPTRIAIEYTRLSNSEKIAVNCDQVAANRLTCVNSGGTRFELTRRT